MTATKLEALTYGDEGWVATTDYEAGNTTIRSWTENVWSERGIAEAPSDQEVEPRFQIAPDGTVRFGLSWIDGDSLRTIDLPALSTTDAPIVSAVR